MERTKAAGSVVRLFTQQPERLAAAWRRVRYEQVAKGSLPSNLLDSVVEPFVREVGLTLGGVKGSAWGRCAGVLRISPARGPRGLYEEFAALRRCMIDAIEVLGAGKDELAAINAAIDEAVDSSVALCERMIDPVAEPPRVNFGGLVVEFYERPVAVEREARGATAASLH